MPTHPHHSTLSKIEEHYTRLVTEHGDSPQAAQWSDQVTQEARMQILTEVGDLKTAKVLDFGCGTGHLLGLLSSKHAFQGEYVGYDLSSAALEQARRKFSGARFERRDVLADGVPEEFDYVLISGVFNNRMDDAWRIITAILRTLFSKTRVALAFNALSTYVDYRDEDLSYIQPDSAFRFCKEQLSPRVTLRHDYLVKPEIVPFEFTVYVYRTDIACRADRSGPDDLVPRG